MIGLLVWAILGVYACEGQSVYKKVIHNYDPQARCLDGSPSFLYVHEGGDPTKILIFFLGGGVCAQETLQATLESCYQRSKDYLGSSLMWPDSLPSQSLQGYLSTDPAISAFAGWTKFFLPYCDGSLHQGNAHQPVKYKQTNLYFRGALITRAHLQWIDSQYSLKQSAKVLLTGMSAGGIAVNLWNNYVKDLAGAPGRVYSVSDSGVFINFPTIKGDRKFEKEMQNLYKVANIDEGTPLKECNVGYPGEEWRCFFIQHGFGFLKQTFLMINSEYDSWSIPNILGIRCLMNGTSGYTLANCSLEELQYIEKYRSTYKTALSRFEMLNDGLSLWSIACSNHVYAFFDQFYQSPRQKIPAVSGYTVRNVVESFVLEGSKTLALDAHGWPSNSGCSY